MSSILTFQSAFAHDRTDEEYTCLSPGMRRREGLTLQTYALARPHLLEPLGSMGRWVLRRNCLEDNVREASYASLHTAVEFALLGRGFVVDLVREPTVKVRLPAQPDQPISAVPRWEDLTPLDEHRLRLELVLDSPRAREIPPEGPSEVLLESQWKLDGFLPGALDPSLPRTGAESAHRGADAAVVLPVAQIPATVGPDDLGERAVVLVLPLPDADWMDLRRDGRLRPERALHWKSVPKS